MVIETCFIFSRSDADHAGELTTGKSTSGFCCFIRDAADPQVSFLFDWGSKIQTAPAHSTPDAEVSAVDRVVCRALLPAQIFLEDIFNIEFPILNEVDNTSAIANIRDGQTNVLRYMKKTQRVSISFLHAVFSTGNNVLGYVQSWLNTADIFTKFLSASLHNRFCADLGLVIQPSPALLSGPNRMMPFVRGSVCEAGFDCNELEPAAASSLTLKAKLEEYFRSKALIDSLKAYFDCRKVAPSGPCR